MPWRLTSPPTTTEKVIGGLCYFTFGIAGLLYILISKKSSQSDLFRFHFLQSILLSFIVGLASYTAQPILGIFLGGADALLGSNAGFVHQGITIIINALKTGFQLTLLYGAVMAFLGKFAEVPLISNIVRENMR